jgi:hypothetical protein
MKLKYFKKFSIKNHYRDKRSKCNIVPHIESFFTNIITQQKDKLSLLLQSDKNWNLEFLLRAYKINNTLYKDSDMSLNLLNKIESHKESVRNKNSFYNVFDALLEKHLLDPNSSSAKELVREIIKKSYLLPESELIELLSSMGVSKDDIDEYRDNFINEENKYTNNLSIKDNNFNIKLHSNRQRITITSKALKKKIILIALDDNKIENVLMAYEYVDKYKPNVILFQKKPVYGLEKNNKYTGLLDKDLIVSYYKEILNSDNFHINNVERLVIIYNIGL